MILLLLPCLATAFGLAPSSSSLVAATHHHRRQQRYHQQQQQKQRHHPPRHPPYDATSSSSTILHLSMPRGGGGDILSTASSTLNTVTSTPGGAFNVAFAVLGVSAAILKFAPKKNTSGSCQTKSHGSSSSSKEEDVATTTTITITTKNNSKEMISSLQRRFLTVFWLLRMADWLQGPYFYQVYATKTGSSSSSGAVWVSRLFLTGFASTAIFGPSVGRACDTYGRKAGTIAFTLLYAASALSTRSNILGVLLVGRILGGIGTSLLFSAPESWLVGEASTIPTSGGNNNGNGLGEIFGLAYAGDSIVAIIAGQLAGFAASWRGPTGPFELSVLFLGLGGLLASLLWTENIASSGSGSDSGSEGQERRKPTIRDAIRVVKSDPKIILVGAIQSMFEAAMYIFVLNWPPAVSSAIVSYFKKFASSTTTTTAAAINTPYGTVFSCFMACCLLGSTIFGRLTASSNDTNNGNDAATDKTKKAISIESFTVGMLTLALVAMGIATLSITSTSAPALLMKNYMSTISNYITTPGALLSILISSLFVFESTVGMYFPTIGTLRSKYFPDSHRSVIMNLFGIPLNAIVVTVFLSIEKLGVQGALGVSTLALGVATLCGIKLKGLIEEEREDEGAIKV